MLELCLGRFQSTFGGLELCHGGVEVLLADGIHFGQRTDALQVAVGFGEPGSGLGKVALYFDDLGFKRPRVDDVQQLVLLDLASLEEVDFLEHAVDSRPNRNIYRAERLADHIQVNRDVASFNLHHGNFHRRQSRWFRLAAGDEKCRTCGQRRRSQDRCGRKTESGHLLIPAIVQPGQQLTLVAPRSHGP